MAFRQIKSPALANQAVLNTKLDVSSVAGHSAAAGVGSLANDTLLMHSASENALKKLSVANLVGSLSTDNLAEGSNLYFTDARAQAAVAADIASAVLVEKTRAEGAESDLQDAIDAEVLRAEGAEQTLTTNLSNEVTRATGREDAIETAYQAADTLLQNQINNIVSNTDPEALDSLAEIVAEFKRVDNVISAAVTSNSNAISAETTRAQGAELALSNSIADVQAELDDTQAGAGLAADGSYVANEGANYIAGATSLNSADVALDSAIKALDTAYKAADTAHSNDISALEGRMDTAESDIDTLESGLAAEVSRADAAEKANASAIEAEVSARGIAVQGAKDYADSQDAAQYVTVTADIATAVSDLESYADQAEADAITSANSYTDARETAITTAYEAYADQAEVDAKAYTDTEITALDTSLSADITAEVDRATAAEEALGDRIDNVISNLDPEAIDSFTEVVAAFESADNGLSGLISANQTAISTEASTRASADTTLQGNIDSEATTRANADTTLQGNIDAEESARISADSDIQAELDATQAGAGLGADGSYTANGDANYIAAATSMKDADNKLDAAIKAMDTAYKAADATHTGAIAQNVTDIATNAADIATNANAISAEQSRAEGAEADLASDISDLQSEVDATQAGAGLSADGSYVANTGANYISGAVSLKDADTKLDAQVKTNADAIAQEAQDRADAVSAEAALRVSGDNALDTKIGNEKTRAEAAEAALSGRVTTNEGDIATLQSGLSSEIADREAGDNALDARLTTEEGNVDSLQTFTGEGTALDTDATDLAGAVNEIKAALGTSEGALAAEVDATQAGAGLGEDGAYTANADANYIATATSLVDADNKLDAAIASADARIDSIISNTDSAALDSLTEIVSAFQDADSNLNDAITTLAQQASDARDTIVDDYEAADTALQTQITANDGDIADLQSDLAAEVSRATAAEGVNATAIATEKTRAEGEEARIEGKVDTNAANLAQEILDRTADVDAEETRATGEEARIEGKVDTNAANLAAEVTRATGAESTLQGNIDAEATARAGADTSIRTDFAAADTQIRTDFAAADTAIQQELDATQTGAGLGTDGAYSANESANYISAATSLKDADNKLDAQSKANADAIAAEVTARTNAVSAEATTRNDADVVLQNNIDAEATTRANADTALSNRATALETEMTATQSGAGLGTDGTYSANESANYIDTAVSLADADNKLDAAIKAENTRATGEESRIETKLDNEVTRATTAEGNLSTAINGVADDLADEVTRATGVESDLQSQIDSIISNTDPAALDSLTEIVAAFQEADGDLTDLVTANQTAITNEVTRAEAAESVLQDNINALETSLEAADVTLQANIDTKVSKAGDTMSGDLAMGGNKVTGLANGTDSADAVTKGQLDAAVSALDLSNFSTDDLEEGSNLYYTDARSRAAISIVDAEGNGDFSYNSTTGVISADLSKSFLELTDVTDASFTGKGEYVAVVNAEETGMELVHASELQIFGQTYRQVIDGDGNQTTFALDFLADEASTLVFVGGVIQDPTSHYTISDADQTVTFTAALPLGTQAVIVARELVGASPFIADGSIQADKLDSTVAVGTRSGNTAVSTTGTVVDSFDASTYRSAKYLIQVDGGDGEFETREALVVHNGTVAYITEFAMVYTGDSLLGDASVQMNGTNVELVYTANAAGASVKVISTYIDA